MRIAIGSDHRGHGIRSKVIQLIERLGHEVEDVGTHDAQPVDYPDITSLVARKVSRGDVDRGIRERARLFSGRTTIDTAPNNGTGIAVELPLSEDMAQ